MKKFVVFLLTFISLSFCFARTNSYSYSDIVYSYAIFKDKGESAPENSGYNANCLNIGGQEYFNNKPLGVYVNVGYHFSNQDSVSTLGVSEINFQYHFSSIIGTCFKYQFSKEFHAFVGLGVHSFFGITDAQKYKSNTDSLGFAGDVGLRFIPKDNFGFVIGTLFSYDSFSRTQVTIYPSNIAGVYFPGEFLSDDGSCKIVCFNPYIGITIHYF